MLQSLEPATTATQAPQCPRGAFVGVAPHHLIVGPAWCKSWACKSCARKKAAVLAKRIAKCPGTRLLTLTVRPSPGESPYDALDRVNAAFRTLIKRIRRAYKRIKCRYLKVVEWTKKGTPHLHVVMQCDYVPQFWLSQQWLSITGSAVVDIRAIRARNGSGRYLAKYLSKSEEHLPGRRRWSASPGFLPPYQREDELLRTLVEHWRFSSSELEHLEDMLRFHGYVPIEGEIWARPVGAGPGPAWLVNPP